MNVGDDIELELRVALASHLAGDDRSAMEAARRATTALDLELARASGQAVELMPRDEREG